MKRLHLCPKIPVAFTAILFLHTCTAEARRFPGVPWEVPDDPTRGDIGGVVIDSLGMPVYGVLVSVGGMAIGVYSTSDGAFLLPGVSSGACTLWARRPPYLDQLVPCTVDRGETVLLTITLAEDPGSPLPHKPDTLSQATWSDGITDEIGQGGFPSGATETSMVRLANPVTLSAGPMRCVRLGGSYSGFVRFESSPWVEPGLYVRSAPGREVFLLQVARGGVVHEIPSDLLLANGYDQSGSFRDYLVSGGANALILDIDSDSSLEAVACTAGGIVVFDGSNADTLYSNDSGPTSAATLTTGDIDGDQRLEILFSKADTLMIADANGRGGAWKSDGLAGRFWYCRPRCLDVDLDGREEILAWSDGYLGGLVLLDLEPGEEWTSQTLIPRPRSASGILITDVDGDGNSDALAVESNGFCWLESRPEAQGGPFLRFVDLGRFRMLGIVSRPEGKNGLPLFYILADTIRSSPAVPSPWQPTQPAPEPWTDRGQGPSYLLTWAPQHYSREGSITSCLLRIQPPFEDILLEWDWHVEGQGDPAKCSVSFQIRSGPRLGELGEWSIEISEPSSIIGLIQPTETAFIQYKAVLRSSSPDVRPVLDAVRILPAYLTE
jgi:hypothetical protein